MDNNPRSVPADSHIIICDLDTPSPFDEGVYLDAIEDRTGCTVELFEHLTMLQCEVEAAAFEDLLKANGIHERIDRQERRFTFDLPSERAPSIIALIQRLEVVKECGQSESRSGQPPRITRAPIFHQQQMEDATKALKNILKDTATLHLGSFASDTTVFHFINAKGKELQIEERYQYLNAKDDIHRAFWYLPSNSLSGINVVLQYPDVKRAWSNRYRSIPITAIRRLLGGARAFYAVLPSDYWTSRVEKCLDASEAQDEKRLRILGLVTIAQPAHKCFDICTLDQIDHTNNMLRDIVRPFDPINNCLAAFERNVRKQSADKTTPVVGPLSEQSEILYPSTWELPDWSHCTNFRIRIRHIRSRQTSSAYAIHKLTQYEEPISFAPPSRSPTPSPDIYFVLDASAILSYIVTARNSEDWIKRAPWDRPEAVFKGAIRRSVPSEEQAKRAQSNVSGSRLRDSGIDYRTITARLKAKGADLGTIDHLDAKDPKDSVDPRWKYEY